MLMPLLHEMPAGQLGVRLVTKAVRYVTLGAWSGSDAVTLCRHVQSRQLAGFHDLICLPRHLCSCMCSSATCVDCNAALADFWFIGHNLP